MNLNSTKCKELIMYKKGYTAEAYNSILGMPQTSEVTILGLTFQPNCKFSTHLKEKLCKANKCLPPGICHQMSAKERLLPSRGRPFILIHSSTEYFLCFICAPRHQCNSIIFLSIFSFLVVIVASMINTVGNRQRF